MKDITKSSYNQMKRCCLDKNHRGYRFKGAKGIKICDRWRESFSNFLEDMGPRPSEEYSLVRLDKEKDFYKENCTWTHKTLQSESGKKIEYQGRKWTLSEWAKFLGVHYVTLYRRLNKGYPLEEVFNVHAQEYIEYLGKSQTIAEWAEERGISCKALCARLKNGWSVERALNTPVKKKKN